MDKLELIEQFREAVDSGVSLSDIIALPRWTSDHWYQLAEICEPVAIEAGEALISSGHAERALYLVASGSVEVALIIRQTQTVSIMSHVAAGSVVGELSFFDSAPRSANVWAVENCHLLRIELADFERFSANHPRMGYELLFALGRVLAFRLRSTTAKIVS
jgi:CRP-like cAMP-binding protein